MRICVSNYCGCCCADITTAIVTIAAIAYYVMVSLAIMLKRYFWLSSQQTSTFIYLSWWLVTFLHGDV